MNTDIIPASNDIVTIETPDLSNNPAAVFIAGMKSQHSRRNMRRYLDQIAQLIGQENGLTVRWEDMRYQHTAAIRARLVEQYAPATVNVMLSALRGVLKTCWKLELMTGEDYHRAADIENVKAETLPAGRDLAAGEIMALSAICNEDATPAGARDAAIIGVLYTCGMRRAELVSLQVADYDPDTGKLNVLHGKGRKQRTVFVTGGARMALADWLTLRGETEGALFTPINKGGKITIKPMTEQAVYKMLKKRAKEAGVKDFSPHDFRRTFVGDMLDRGVDIATVANITGHSSVDTTRRYDRRPDEAKRNAAEKLHFPYQRVIR
jgi:site-specific recombinase XerD